MSDITIVKSKKGDGAYRFRVDTRVGKNRYSGESLTFFPVLDINDRTVPVSILVRKILRVFRADGSGRTVPTGARAAIVKLATAEVIKKFGKTVSASSLTVEMTHPTESLLRKLFPGSKNGEADLSYDQRYTLNKLRKASAVLSAAGSEVSKAGVKQHKKALAAFRAWKKSATKAGLAGFMSKFELATEMTATARQMSRSRVLGAGSPRWKDGGHTGYSLQKVWEMYVKALKSADTDSSMTWYYEFWMKGGDQHAADAAMGTSGRSAPKKAPLPFRMENGAVRAMGRLLGEGGKDSEEIRRLYDAKKFKDIAALIVKKVGLDAAHDEWLDYVDTLGLPEMKVADLIGDMDIAATKKEVASSKDKGFYKTLQDLFTVIVGPRDMKRVSYRVYAKYLRLVHSGGNFIPEGSAKWDELYRWMGQSGVRASSEDDAKEKMLAFLDRAGAKTLGPRKARPRFSGSYYD